MELAAESVVDDEPEKGGGGEAAEEVSGGVDTRLTPNSRLMAWKKIEVEHVNRALRFMY